MEIVIQCGYEVEMVTQGDFSGGGGGTPSDMHARWEWSHEVDAR